MFVIRGSAIWFSIPLIEFLPVAGLYKNKEQTNDLETNAASPTTLNSLTLYLFQPHNNVWNGCQKALI